MLSPDMRSARARVRRRLRIYIIAFAAVLAIGFFALGRLRAPAPAPPVVMHSIEGERLSFAKLRGRVVLVNFWATDCSVCLQEMSAMMETYERFRPRGLEAIFVAMPYDRPDRVLAYARSKALPFKVVLDVRGEINLAFGHVRATPTTFIVDKRGRIVERILGAPDFAQLHRSIAARLDEQR